MGMPSDDVRVRSCRPRGSLVLVQASRAAAPELRTVRKMDCISPILREAINLQYIFQYLLTEPGANPQLGQRRGELVYHALCANGWHGRRRRQVDDGVEVARRELEEEMRRWSTGPAGSGSSSSRMHGCSQSLGVEERTLVHGFKRGACVRTCALRLEARQTVIRPLAKTFTSVPIVSPLTPRGGSWFASY